MTDQDAQALRLPESNRVEAFSDGVFAIALTLLVLDLHAPSGPRGQFVHVLARQWPAYVAYLAAFLNIAAIWINHHDLFSRIRRVDAPDLREPAAVAGVIAVPVARLGHLRGRAHR